MREEAAGYAAPAGPGGKDVGKTGPALGPWAGLVWGLGLGLSFGSLFLFLIQTKFEFK